jgi:hypothetical protein
MLKPGALEVLASAMSEWCLEDDDCHLHLLQLAEVIGEARLYQPSH